MSKTVPSAIVLPTIGDFGGFEDVLASSFKTDAQALHYMYERAGTHIPGPVFEPEWSSLDFSTGGDVYHATAGTNPVNLDDWQGIFKFTRPIHDTGTAAIGYSLRFDVYARNLDVRASIVRLNTTDGNTSASTTGLATLVTSHAAADSEWQSTFDNLTPAEISRSGSEVNGSAFFLVYVEAKVPASGAGDLYTWSLREYPRLAGTALPRTAY